MGRILRVLITCQHRGNMEITVRITGQYGLRVVYPVCEKALLLARLAGFKTLPAHALETIKALGYSINVQPETL
jgi:lauroyl/myristoyl acyltransferase